MQRIADQIMKRMAAHEKGAWVCTSKDFLDLGNRRAVGQALSRLAKKGQLRRVGRGLYDVPRMSDILKCLAPANLYAAIDAVVRRDNIRILPDGGEAAHRLGLTNGVPAKVIYVTDGCSRKLKIGGWTVQFRHAGPKVMWWAGKPSAPVVQALRWFHVGLTRMDLVVSTLRRQLPDSVKLDLIRNSRHLPGWAVPLAHSIARDCATAVRESRR